jgi:hypothetical protein
MIQVASTHWPSRSHPQHTSGSPALPFSVVDNSDFSPPRLTARETRLMLASQGGSLCFPIQIARMMMVIHVFVFLLVVCLLLSLALLWRLDWFHPGPSSSRGVVKRSTLHRLLKPRCPDDCPACGLASTPLSCVEPAPLPVRPWPEVKSRRGAPKRIDTEGFACPNHQCPYFGITDARIHALVGDGKHGHAELIQTFRCQACRTTFSARRHTPLYRLKTSSYQVAVVLAALRHRCCGSGWPSTLARRFFRCSF